MYSTVYVYLAIHVSYISHLEEKKHTVVYPTPIPKPPPLRNIPHPYRSRYPWTSPPPIPTTGHELGRLHSSAPHTTRFAAHIHFLGVPLPSLYTRGDESTTHHHTAQHSKARTEPNPAGERTAPATAPAPASWSGTSEWGLAAAASDAGAASCRGETRCTQHALGGERGASLSRGRWIPRLVLSASWFLRLGGREVEGWDGKVRNWGVCVSIWILNGEVR